MLSCCDGTDLARQRRSMGLARWIVLAGLAISACGGITSGSAGTGGQDAATDACSYTFPYCSSDGHIATGCCPVGANCAPPASYCDLGGGRCVGGSCPADAGSDAACPHEVCINGHLASSIACCPPGAPCVAEQFCDLGGGRCELAPNGTAADCPADAGSSDAAVTCPDGGYAMQVCINGHVTNSCCPAGAPCHPSEYCVLGGGLCTLGACSADAGNNGDAGPPECFVDSDCPKPQGDECNICKDMSRRVCKAGTCVCACQL